MASISTQTQEDISELLKTLVLCSLCNTSGLSNTMKMMPCFHSVCIDCMIHHLEEEEGENSDEFQCPGCNSSHDLPNGGLEEIDDNFLSSNMKFLSEVLSNNPSTCWACETIGEDTPSTSYCLNCQKHFCQIDGRKHMGTSGHEVILHSEMSTEKIIPKLLSSHGGNCENSEIHEEPKPYLHFCVKCQSLSCSECLTYNHEGHTKMPLKKAGEKFGEELKHLVKDMKKIKPSKKKGLKDLKTNQAKMRQNKDTTAQEIKSFGEEIKKMVDKLVKEKLENLEIDADKEEHDFQEAVDEVASDNNTLKMAGKFMDVFLEHSSPVNILHKYTVYKKSLETCMKDMADTVKIEAKTFPFHHDTMYLVERSLTNMFHGKELGDIETIVSQEIEPFNGLAVDYDNNEAIVVGGQDVKILGMDGKEKGQIQCQGLENACAVTVHDHVIYIADETKGEIVGFDRDGNKKKSFKFPEMKSYNNEGIGLAFNPVDRFIYSSCLDTQSVYKCSIKGTQVKPFIAEGLDGPNHLCVIRKKGLVVSNCYSNEMHMYSFNGKLLWKYGSEGEGDEQFNFPAGVCTDHLDNIFVADEHNQRIHYISAKGTLIEVFELDFAPCSISFINDRLIVMDEGGKLEIMKCNYV